MPDNTYSRSDLVSEMEEAREEMERQLDLSDREIGLMNFLITASALRFKGVTDLHDVISQEYVCEDEYAAGGWSQEVRIVDRQLVWSDTSTRPEASYEQQRQAVITEFIRRLHEITPEPGTQWRGTAIEVTAVAKDRGQYERLEFWRLSDELVAELDV